MLHVPRELNAVADMVAGRALEEDRELLFVDDAFNFESWFGAGHRELHLVLSSDGACRDGGKCAVGIVVTAIITPIVQALNVHALSCAEQEEFPKKVVACFGCTVPNGTSVTAEFEACCKARRFLMEWLVQARFVQ